MQPDRLINCPVCDNPLEERAVKCPQCGFPLQEARLAAWRPYIIVAALMASLLIYAALVLTIPATSELEARTLALLEYAFAGISAAVAAAVILWPEPAGPITPEPAIRRTIFRAALAESVAIYGLALHFLGAPLTHALGFVVASLALLGVVASSLPALGQATRRWLVEHHQRQDLQHNTG